MSVTWEYLCQEYEADKWVIADLQSYQLSDGAPYLSAQLHRVDNGKVVGWSNESHIPVDPDNPYIVTWNLNGEMARFNNRDEAVAYVLDFAERYEQSTREWTEERIALFHVKSEADADVVLHAGLTGRLPYVEEPRTPERERIKESYQRLIDYTLGKVHSEEA